ncbi:MAG TPA: DNA recombination protein RmuC [Spongiibacteraceae bacterium]|nr:DNA recombination protein RmuC [Spongiibacteraceae bacterium]
MALETLLIVCLTAAVLGCVVAVGLLRQRTREFSRQLEQQQQFVAQRENHVLRLQQREHELLQREGQLQTDVAVLRTTLNEQQRNAEEKLKLLSDAKQQLTLEFQTLAQKILEEKSERFTKQNQANIETTLNPLREQLSEFRKRVEDVYDKDSKDRTSLRAELSHLQQLNQRIGEEALNLTRALKGDNKAQGNWGEVVLERVLEESGLRKGHEYDTQVALRSEEGQRRNPDVIVHLPDSKDIVIDAKVTLTAYERYCNASSEAERDSAMRQHIAAVRAHIDGLSFKQYENLPGVRSLDFVLIFIPIEAAFLAAFEHDASVFREAYEKNIIVVSPTTLLATLRTVQTIWRYERQNANADAIAKQAGALHDQFALLLQSLQDIGKHLDKSRDAYEQTLDRFSRGRGNLVKRVNDLAKLGAKTKKALPSELIERAEDDMSDLLPNDQESTSDANELEISVTTFSNGD